MPVQDLPNLELDPKVEQEIASWLSREILEVKHARAELDELWREIRKYCIRTEIPEKKDFPWEGAANIMIQIMMTYIMQIKSWLSRTIWQPKDPFIVEPTIKELYDAASPVRRYINFLVTKQLRMKENFSDVALLELIKLGTTVSKTVYAREKRVIHVYEEATDSWIETVDVLKEGATTIPVPLEDHFFPLETRVYEHARWKSHRFRLNANEVLTWEFNDDFNKGTLEDLRGFEVTTRTEAEDVTDQEYNVQPTTMEEFEFHEVWFDYLLPGKKVPVKLTGFLHPISEKFARLTYNWYPMQLDPFDLEVFEPQEHFVYGVGVGQMSLPTQKEVSIMHCQRLDGATIANAKAFKVKSDTLLTMDISIHPGAKIPVDEMDDLEPFDLGSKFDSTIEEETHTLQLLQQRIGINDFTPLQNLSRARATAALQAMQEALGRFDSVMERVRVFYTKIMLKCLLLEQKYRSPNHFEAILGPEDGAIVAMFMQQDARTIYDNLGLSVTATSATFSRDIERQAKLSLFGVLLQYYSQLREYVVGASQLPPNVAPVFIRIASSLSKFIEDLLENFDIHNRAEFVLDIGELFNVASQQIAQGAAQGAPGPPGVGGPAGVPQQANGAAGGQPRP